MTHSASPRSTSIRTHYFSSKSKHDHNLLMKLWAAANPSPLHIEEQGHTTLITQRFIPIPCTYPLWIISNLRSWWITRNKNRLLPWMLHQVISITISLNNSLRKKCKSSKKRGDPKSLLLGNEVHRHLWEEATPRVRTVASIEECNLRTKNLKSRSKEVKSPWLNALLSRVSLRIKLQRHL